MEDPDPPGGVGDTFGPTQLSVLQQHPERPPSIEAHESDRPEKGIRLEVYSKKFKNIELTQGTANSGWVTGVESENISGSIVLSRVGDGSTLSVTSGEGVSGHCSSVEIDGRTASDWVRVSGWLKIDRIQFDRSTLKLTGATTFVTLTADSVTWQLDPVVQQYPVMSLSVEMLFLWLFNPRDLQIGFGTQWYDL